MQGINIVSDGGIIVGSGSFNLFNFRTNCSITGLSVHGCGRVFYIQSDNSDSAKFDIDRCTFQNQLVEAWGDDGASASSILNVTRTKLYQTNGGADYPRLATMNVDTVRMEGNWIYYGGVGSPFYTDCQVFDFDNNLCVPNFLLASKTQRSWFYNHRTLNLRGNRFGAEGGGCPIVEHAGKYTTGEMKVTARDNAIYSSNDVPFKFYTLPTAIDIDSNFGYDLSPGIVQFGTSITVAEIQAAMARGDIYINDITTREYQVSGNRDVMRAMASEGAVTHSATSINEIVISANTDLGGGSRVGTSTGSALHNYGDGRTGRKFTATGATTLISFLINPTGVTEISAAIATNEWMTVVYNITNPGTAPLSGHIVNGIKKEPVLIPPGDHYYAFSSPKFAGVDPNVSGSVLLQDGDTIIIGPLRVFKGVKNAAVIPSQFVGSAIPTSGLFFAGELIRNVSPVASGYLYWVCTATGAPGTWKNACSIAA